MLRLDHEHDLAPIARHGQVALVAGDHDVLRRRWVDCETGRGTLDRDGTLHPDGCTGHDGPDRETGNNSGDEAPVTGCDA